MLAIRGDLFQACCLRMRMTNEALELGLDQLAGLEFVWRPSSVPRGAIVFSIAHVSPQTTSSRPAALQAKGSGNSRANRGGPGSFGEASQQVGVLMPHRPTFANRKPRVYAASAQLS